MFPICLLLRWAINKIALVFITRQKESSSPCFALKSMLTILLCSFHNSAIETSSSHNTQSYTTQLWFSQKGMDARQGKQWWISQSEWLLQMPSVGLVCSCLVPDSCMRKGREIIASWVTGARWRRSGSLVFSLHIKGILPRVTVTLF